MGLYLNNYRVDWEKKQSVWVVNVILAAAMLTTLATVCLLRVAVIFFVLPVYQTMECIVGIYIASWIAAGLAFTVMYAWKQRKLRN